MAQEKQKFVGNKKSKLVEKTVREAAAALLAFHKKRKESSSHEELLFSEPSKIKLIIALWKITGKKAKTYRINVPHPLRTPETEVCLFAKDDDGSDSEATARHYQELLESKGVTEVNEVMPLQVFKREYKAFESRRQLAKRYDIFLADERIFRLMHVHLGKEFYRRKKYPVTVNVTCQDLKGEILKAINATYFILTNRGNTNHLTVAHVDMTLDQVTENIMEAVQGITTRIPHGWSNIKALYVRTDESVSLPLHASLVFKNWETKTDVNSKDIWRLKKQLEVTGGKTTRAKPRVTPEEDRKAKRFQKRSQKKAAREVAAEKTPSSPGGAVQKRAVKRKAATAQEDSNLDDLVKATPRKLIKEKPTAATSLKKAKTTRMGTPGKLQTKSFSAKKATEK